jgi:hypothetical protein
MIRLKHVVVALAAFAMLNGCGNNGQEASPPGGGLQATAGDGTVTVTWNDDLTVNYWLFVSTDPTMTVDNFSTRTDIRILRSARSPFTLCGYPDGRTLYLAMNGRTGQGPGGAGTPTINATLRPAGATWTPGSAPAFDFNGVGFAPVTSCLSTGTPSGVFVAVGPGAAIASGTDGRTFTARTPPTGFTTDLNAVATFTANPNVPTNPGLKIIAVGAGGASIVSTDGTTWTTGVAFDAALPTLRALAVNAGTFIAVGDGGAVQITADGIAWTARTSGTTSTLRGIGCSGTTCIAVGDGGAVLRTVDSGATWTVQAITGTPALKAVAYGNFNNNLGAATPAINTWVAIGAAGVAYYSIDGGVTWTALAVPGAADFVAISYLTRFVAIDGTGGAFFSVDGQTWTGPVATGLAGPRSIIGNGTGFVAVGAGGQTVSAF